MPKFAYVAKDRAGKDVKGTLSVSNASAAWIKLENKDLEVVSVTEKVQKFNVELTKSHLKKVDLVNVSMQLSAFLQAGIPITEGVNEIKNTTNSKAVKRIMTDISNDLQQGSTLTDAVAKHPKDFPVFYRGILSSAELTGDLDNALDQLSVYIERDMESRRKIKGALTYPAVIIVVGIAAVAILMGYVMPKFVKFFDAMHAELPLATRILLTIVSFFQNWGILLLVLIILLAVVYKLGTRYRPGKKIRDTVLLKIPILKEAIQYAMVERFTRILAAMVQAGVPLPTAIRVAATSLGNVVYEDALLDAREKMLSGEGLSVPLARGGLFPDMASQMINVGEKTGTLDTQLTLVATYYARELDYKIKKMTSLIEPTVIVILGICIGFVAIAIASAMYGISQAVTPSPTDQPTPTVSSLYPSTKPTTK